MNLYNNQLSSIDNSQIIAMHQLREKAFYKRLKWQVDSFNGMEKDQFDNIYSSYLLVKSQSNEVIGCARLIPTDQDYMFKNIFSELARNEEIPKKSNVWEISRFTLDRTFERNYDNGVSNITKEMFSALYEFAIANSINNFVLVTTVSCERILRLLGIPTRRFGDGMSSKLGKVDSVALWVDINDSYKQAVNCKKISSNQYLIGCL
jgi:acyl homoserine lactone synthase